MKGKLTCCAKCHRLLAQFKEVHAVSGQLYCSKDCAVKDIADDYIMNAKEMALEAYACEAEVIATADIMADEISALVGVDNSADDQED